MNGKPGVQSLPVAIQSSGIIKAAGGQKTNVDSTPNVSPQFSMSRYVLSQNRVSRCQPQCPNDPVIETADLSVPMEMEDRRSRFVCVSRPNVEATELIWKVSEFLELRRMATFQGKVLS